VSAAVTGNRFAGLRYALGRPGYTRMTASFKRYLRLLGIDHRPSGLSGLRLLVGHHLAKVPFENISKLLLYGREGAGRTTTLSEFLDGIEFSDLGGTCYSNNPFFAQLLRELGYDATLLGADMSQPNVHTCIRVGIDGLSYHVDVGFAAPFREPLRLDRLPAHIHEGNNRYTFQPDGPDRYRMSMFSGDEPREFYVAHGPALPRSVLDEVVVKSFSLRSHFLQHLRISRVFDSYSVDLMDRKLYRHENGKTTLTEIRSLAGLMAALEEQFHMPRCPVEPAISILERLTGTPFFEAVSRAGAHAGNQS
jgi:N-hydroxyarylamine O-acetyltransferase